MESHPLVLFDGVCTLCNRWARFIVRHDPEARLRIGSLQWAAQQADLQKLSIGIGTDSIVLIQDGRVYHASTAVVHMARHLRFPANMIRVLIIVPRPIRDWIYGIVARNRYRWFGRREACPVPDDSWKGRLVG